MRDISQVAASRGCLSLRVVRQDARFVGREGASLATAPPTLWICLNKNEHEIYRRRTVAPPITAVVASSGPKAWAPATPRISASFVLARLTRLLTVPTAQRAISATSS